MSEPPVPPPSAPAPTPASLVEACAVYRTYRIGATEIPVLRGVSLQVRAGESVAIMGASGSGKSTLLHVLGGLDTPSAGRVLFQGEELYRLSPARRAELRATRIGFVFQAYHLLPELDVLENVMLPAMSRRGALRQVAGHRQRAQALLERVGLQARATHRPAELSGGEQQRAALARALMNAPQVVLADEPTGNLDSHTGEQVLHYLFDLVRVSGHTLIMVTHSESIAARCGRQLHLRDGVLEPG